MRQKLREIVRIFTYMKHVEYLGSIFAANCGYRHILFIMIMAVFIYIKYRILISRIRNYLNEMKDQQTVHSHFFNELLWELCSIRCAVINHVI